RGPEHAADLAGVGTLMSVMFTSLQTAIEQLFYGQTEHYGDEYFQAFDQFKAALNEGRIRAAEPDPSSPTGWKVNAWVKKGILLGFRIGRIVEMPVAAVGVYPGGAGDRRKPKARRLQGGATAYQFADQVTFPLTR